MYSQPLEKRLVKGLSVKHVFTSLNLKLFVWSQSVVSHVPKTTEYRAINFSEVAWRLVSRITLSVQRKRKLYNLVA